MSMILQGSFKQKLAPKEDRCCGQDTSDIEQVFKKKSSYKLFSTVLEKNIYLWYQFKKSTAINLPHIKETWG